MRAISAGQRHTRAGWRHHDDVAAFEPKVALYGEGADALGVITIGLAPFLALLRSMQLSAGTPWLTGVRSRARFGRSFMGRLARRYAGGLDLADRVSAPMSGDEGIEDWRDYVLPDLRDEFNAQLVAIEAAVDAAGSDDEPAELFIPK